MQNTWYSGHSLLSKHWIKASVIHSDNAYSFALRSSNNTRGLQTESLINDLTVIDGRYKNLVRINKHIKNKALEHLDGRLQLPRCGKTLRSAWQTDQDFPFRVWVNAHHEPAIMNSQEKTKPEKLKIRVDSKLSPFLYCLNGETIWEFSIIWQVRFAINGELSP